MTGPAAVTMIGGRLSSASPVAVNVTSSGVGVAPLVLVGVRVTIHDPTRNCSSTNGDGVDGVVGVGVVCASASEAAVASDASTTMIVRMLVLLEWCQAFRCGMLTENQTASTVATGKALHVVTGTSVAPAGSLREVFHEQGRDGRQGREGEGLREREDRSGHRESRSRG